MGQRSRTSTLRERLQAQLLAKRARLPTSALGRLGRGAGIGLRGGSLLLGQRAAALFRSAAEDGELDHEALAGLISSLGQLKGVAMKMGQILSYIDVALPEELREALSTLQTHAQPMPFDEVEAVLRRELGDRGETLIAAMEHKPVAAASIGQVHRACLPEGQRVAIKVQYPGIERAIGNEFGFASVGHRLPSLFFPRARIGDFIDEARARILEECDYQHEAGAQQRFARIYDQHDTIEVPDVFTDWCSRRVLCSAWVDGARFDDYLASEPSQEARDRVGAALFEFYVGSLFRHGLYNCDPHPGNYLLLGDGRVAVLDYGCTRAFEPDFVAKLADLTLAVHSDATDELHRAFVALGMVRSGQRYDFDTARDLVRAYYGPMLRDEEQGVDLGAGMQMRQVMERKLELLKLTLPAEFLFLFRIRFGLMSVLAQLGARANWYQIERACIDA